MTRPSTGIALVSALMATVLGAQGGPQQIKVEATVAKSDIALLVIDIQNFYFPGGKLPLVGPLEASEQAKQVLAAFRARHWPVVHIQHLPKEQAKADVNIADPQYRIHASVTPLAGEPVIGKHYANAFRDTELLDTLRALGVRKLVIVGMQTHMCVEAATRAAADLGFEVTVIQDACATRDLTLGAILVPAAHVHAAALAAMASSYAHVMSAPDWLATLR
jgi:nicotinamidase-related amidase